MHRISMVGYPVVFLMNARLPFAPACIFVLALLLAAPVLAATVACPPSCSCMVPAEAKKLGSSGYCSGKQAVCGYDAQKNEKYCYEKPVTTTRPVPPATRTAVTTAKVTVTSVQPTVPAAACTAGCTCLSSADGKARGLPYCGGGLNPCGYGRDGETLFCFSLPTATLTAIPPAVSTPPVTPCPPGCSCFAEDMATAAGFRRCSQGSGACAAGLSGKPMYCYAAEPVTAEGRETAGTPGYPVSRVVPAAILSATPAPAVPAAPVPGMGIISAIRDFFGSLFGAPRTGTPPGLVPCNGTLTSLLTDPDNCGSCGNRCPGLHERYVCCHGTCRDLSADENNCGSCGLSCPQLTTCCDGACTDIYYDENHCGDCFRRCSESEICCSGTCREKDESGFVAEECVNLRGIVAAGIAIPLAAPDDDDTNGLDACTNATSCPGPGMTCCLDHCRDLNISAANCGSCGNVCPAGQVCTGGTCTAHDIQP